MPHVQSHKGQCRKVRLCNRCKKRDSDKALKRP
jgi:hypothetical protein